MITEKILSQISPSETTIVTAYRFLETSGSAIIKTFTICNTSNFQSTFDLYISNDDDQFDNANAIYVNCVVESKQTVKIDGFWAIGSTGGSIGFKSSLANSLTLTICGAERTG
jgi:hypothetical protein